MSIGLDDHLNYPDRPQEAATPAIPPCRLPFSVRDEFGKPCDDRIWAWAQDYARAALKAAQPVPHEVTPVAPGEDEGRGFMPYPDLEGLLHKTPAPQERGSNSMGRYHTGLTDLGYQSRSTVNPHEAKRYTKASAEQVAADLNVHMMACEWRAVEHGFHTAAPQEPAEPVAPAGYVLVPLEPTPAMINAAVGTPGIKSVNALITARAPGHNLWDNRNPPLLQAWRAMLKAAPTQADAQDARRWRQDAMRYRWLRDNAMEGEVREYASLPGVKWDSTIDADIARDAAMALDVTNRDPKA
jgi:hypothetical protein